MADYGVTPEGFLIKRLQEVLEQNRSYAEQVFADLVEDGEAVDTTDSSVLGRLTKLVAPSSAELWEVAQDVYSSLDPEKATGDSLDVIVSYGGLLRMGESRSYTTLIVGGDLNTVIPQGSIVKDSKYNTEWQTTSPTTLLESNTTSIGVTPVNIDFGTVYTVVMETPYTTVEESYTQNVIGATYNDVLNAIKEEFDSGSDMSAVVQDGKVVISPSDLYSKPQYVVTGLDIEDYYTQVEVESVEYGDKDASIGRLTVIATPVIGWSSAFNPFTAIIGRLDETDEELRLRFRNSKLARSVGFARGIKDGISNLLGVKEVTLYENTTGIVDDKGIPPHSFKVIVNGGNPSEIGREIFNNRPIGIGSEGTSEVEVVDGGQTYIEKFSRPTFVDIYMEIKLKPDSEWNNELTNQLKENILQYFEDEISVGEDVKYSRMFIPVNKIPNQSLESLKIGLAAGSVAYQDIEIPYDSLAVIGRGSIDVQIIT